MATRRGLIPVNGNSAVEVELKFELTKRDVRRLCQTPAFKAMQAGPPKRKTLRATYYDTPDLQLAARKVSLRVRKESRQFVQYVKSRATSAAGSFARREWEWRVAGPTLDPSILKRDEEVRPLFKGINPQKLVPIFTTEITRQSRILHTPGGARVKCDIDQGRIMSGEQEAPLYELELELMSGTVGDLLELGRMVSEAVPARLSARTKAQRGMTLYRGQGQQWNRARDLDLHKSPTAEEVLSLSVTEGLRHLISNEDCVLTRCDIEGVHQMRVAMRRMRAAVTMYKKLLPRGSYENLADGLKAAGGELGPARDWDVFAEELLPPVLDGFDNAPELQELAALAERKRDQAYARTRHLILSDDYARLLTGVLYWVGRRVWRNPEAKPGRSRMDAPATGVAADVLSRRHAQVLKTGKGLKDLPTEQRHRLRLAVKKARYAAEFFAPLYAAKKAQAYIKALRALQDGLGHLNDLANAQAMMSELAQNARGTKAKAVSRAQGMVEGWYLHAYRGDEAELLKAWKTFTKTKTFW